MWNHTESRSQSAAASRTALSLQLPIALRPVPLFLAWVILGVLLPVLLVPLPVEASQEAAASAERTSALVAEVEVRGPGGAVSGSAILVGHHGNTGFLVTTHHLVQPAERVEVRFPSLGPDWYPADRLGTGDPSQDLAVLRVRADAVLVKSWEELDVRRLGDQKALEKGASVRTAGVVAGRLRTPSHGAVRGVRGSVVLFDGSCPPSLSGGALLDQRWGIQGMILEREGPLCTALTMGAIQKAIRGDRQVAFVLEELPKDTVMDVWIDTELLDKKEGQIVVTVLPFENSTDAWAHELDEVAQEVFNELLRGVPGVRVVTRDRIAAILDEYKSTVAGIVKDTSRASQLGQVLGADYLVIGSIVHYHVDRRHFQVYGNEGVRDHYELSVILQLIDLASAELRFSENFRAQHQETYRRASSAPPKPAPRDHELLSRLSEQARDLLAQELLGRSLEERPVRDLPVRVAVDSYPRGADVELEGRYRGSTPMVLELQPGRWKMAIERAGYRRWEKWVEVEKDMEVKVALERD